MVGNGLCSRMRKARSLSATTSAVAAPSTRPNESRAIQRRMLATASRASTGVPSWNISPSRSVKRQVAPSSSTLCPAAICGCGRDCASSPYSVSNTRNPWFRVT